MAYRLTRRKSKTTAPADILLTTARNPATRKKEAAVFAKCQYGGTVAGPIWGWKRASMRRALATLSGTCDCGRSFHRAREVNRV